MNTTTTTNNATTINYTDLSSKMHLLGLNEKRIDLFNKFALDGLVENPLEYKMHLLASEFQFVYDTTVSQIDKLKDRQKALENQLKEYERKASACVLGTWTLTKTIKGIEVAFTLEDLRKDIVEKLNLIDEKMLALAYHKDELSKVLSLTGFEDLVKTELTDVEKLESLMLRFDLLGSKCLDISNSFVNLGKACGDYNRAKLAKADTKESYLAMKENFASLAELFKVTKDTKGNFAKVRTFSFNSSEMEVLAGTLFSSASIGIIENNGKAYYTLTAEKQPVILKNIVKIAIMKLQGVKITTENIK